jgi:hypothetical protein
MDLFTFENLANFGVLIFLQAVLGFDNLLYIRRACGAGESSSHWPCESCCCSW